VWWFWLGLLVVTSFIFWLLWRFAAKIEREEQEEQGWLTYIEQLQQYDPYEAQRWRLMFDQKFK
jgi:hypothetical protein